MDAESTPHAVDARNDQPEDQWVVLVDPTWQSAGETDMPPIEAVVGGWFVDSDGTVGRFCANPEYVPSQEDSPTDPVDATLRLVVRGEATGEQLLSTVREAVFGIALDENGVAIVTPAPDEVPSVLVATAPAHSRRVDAASWQEITAEELAHSLPDEGGVDVLFNPGASASMRILAGALKDAVAD